MACATREGRDSYADDKRYINSPFDDETAGFSGTRMARSALDTQMRVAVKVERLRAMYLFLSAGQTAGCLLRFRIDFDSIL